MRKNALPLVALAFCVIGIAFPWSFIGNAAIVPCVATAILFFVKLIPGEDPWRARRRRAHRLR
jgi:hypothetical protein